MYEERCLFDDRLLYDETAAQNAGWLKSPWVDAILEANDLYSGTPVVCAISLLRLGEDWQDVQGHTHLWVNFFVVSHQSAYKDMLHTFIHTFEKVYPLLFMQTCNIFILQLIFLTLTHYLPQWFRFLPYPVWSHCTRFSVTPFPVRYFISCLNSHTIRLKLQFALVKFMKFANLWSIHTLCKL